MVHLMSYCFIKAETELTYQNICSKNILTDQNIRSILELQQEMEITA